MHWDRGLIVVRVYYFQIWNEHIFLSGVISSHLGLFYWDTQYIYIYYYENDIVHLKAKSSNLSDNNSVKSEEVKS